MEKNKWNDFNKAKERFRKYAGELSDSHLNLKKLQQKLINSRSEGKNSSYTVETPVVYNSALDEISTNDEIKLILVADNPGRREQAAENRRYLTGPSGKIAANFFKNNPQLGIDFRKNVIILNKTPVHTPRTVELRELCRLDSSGKILDAVNDSQIEMASLLLEFHEALLCPVWITGYSEMKKGGIFETYTQRLKDLYLDRKKMKDQLFIYRHFSMNQFTIDLNNQSLPGESLKESLARIGFSYREKIIG